MHPDFLHEQASSCLQTSYLHSSINIIHYIYTWILLWAEKSAGPQSGKIFRRIPKKRRRPEKTSGSKILKNRDDKRLDHTQGNCHCAASSFSGAHSNLPVPIALAHLANGLRAKPSHNISNLCPSKDFQEKTKEYVARNPSFSATVSLKCFFTKWAALHDSYASQCFMKACLRTAPQ